MLTIVVTADLCVFVCLRCFYLFIYLAPILCAMFVNTEENYF